ncbi:hypothetical protein HPB52_023338 [Rhipicephalus sanguineus]|uniref:exodeoxyribonuclease III n=1 Tax=Rhipicephalus sanguineus TaxID=34632 RepID=A0A9D4QEH1_RHISA|nr:hypothetical protein HPB52_023338 [Rhipicephalus sanguineus]
MSVLKIATWNVRRFSDREKQHDILRFARDQGIDLLFIQEANFRTPLEVANFRREFQTDAFFSLTHSHACGVGVIFATGPFRQKAHCTFGANGRVIMVDVYVDNKKIRFENVNAPVQRSDTNAFFRALHPLLLEPLPHVLVRDFNCVVDSSRNVRGPGQGGSTYHAKELVKTLRHLYLTDAWVFLHKDLFAPTGTSKTTASRIDRIYLPDFLLPKLEACEVLQLPGRLSKKTDHFPVTGTIGGNPGPRTEIGRWRLDPALLKDEVSFENARKAIEATTRDITTMTLQKWDDLKATWKGIMQEEGKARHRRGSGSRKITEALRQNGTETHDPGEIEEIFRDHFREQFEVDSHPDTDPCEQRLATLCKNLQVLEEADRNDIRYNVTSEELQSAIKTMTQNTSPRSDGLPTAFYTVLFDVVRGFPLTGDEEVRVLAYADDVSLFVRDARSLRVFQDVMGDIEKVEVVRVLGVYFARGGVAQTTWQVVLERANKTISAMQQLDMTLREKALAVKTAVCGYADFVSRVEVMPRKTAVQLNKLINSLFRNMLQLPESSGGLGLPHVQTVSKMLGLKTARRLYHTAEYIGRKDLVSGLGRPGGLRRNQEGPGARTTGQDPLGGRSRPADQASTHYRRRGSGPPQDEETTGKGLGRRCLRATTTGHGPCDRRHLGLPGPGAPRTPWCRTCCLGKDAQPPEEDACHARGPGPARVLPEWPPTTTVHRTGAAMTRTCGGGFPQGPSPRPLRRRPAPSLADSPVPPPPRRPRPGSAASDRSPRPPSSSEQPQVEPRPPVLNNVVLTVFYPVPGTLRCPQRGCAAVYTTSSWSLCVRYLRRHLEGAHGIAVRERVTVCAGCAAPLPAQPQRYSCGADEPPASTFIQPGLVCSRGSGEFRLPHHLDAHLRWHDLHDVAGPVARSPSPPSSASVASTPTPSGAPPPDSPASPTSSLPSLPRPPSPPLPSTAPPPVRGPPTLLPSTPCEDLHSAASSPPASPVPSARAASTASRTSMASPTPSEPAEPEDPGPDVLEADDADAPVGEPALDLPPDRTRLLAEQIKVSSEQFFDSSQSLTWGPVTSTWTPGSQPAKRRSSQPLVLPPPARGTKPSPPSPVSGLPARRPPRARRSDDLGRRLLSRRSSSLPLQPTSTPRSLLRLCRPFTRAQRKLRITRLRDTPPTRPGERPATPTGMATNGNLPVTRLIVAEGFRVNNEKVAVEAVGPPITYVNVYRFPAYVPDEILTNASAQYGKVKGVSFATVASRPHKLNGVRVVKIETCRPVPNFATVAGHKIMCEYRGMKRVCERCGEVGHTATACSALFCKRCGIFGHDIDGCAAECKRCGGKDGTRDCFRKRSYVAAARGAPPTAGDIPEGGRVSAPSNVQATTSGLQVLTPRAPPQLPRQPSPYWDSNQQEVAQTATPLSEAQATLQESSDTDGATTVTVDSATEPSSAESSRESWSDARWASEEQEVPQIAEQLDDNITPTPQLDSRNFPPLPPASGPATRTDDIPTVSCGRYVLPSDNDHDRSATGSSPRHPRPSTSSAASPPPAPCTAPTGLEKRHRSRSRQRQTDANKSANTGRTGSQEMSLRRSQGGKKEPPDGGVNKAPTVTAMTKIRFATWNVRGFRDRAKQQEVLRFAESQAIDLLVIQETNFRTQLEVVTFRRDHQVDAFFSWTRTRACGVGVIFVLGRFRQKSDYMFDANGRTIMLDVFIDGKKIRFVNIYAPVTRSNTNNYFKEVHQLLLEALPHVLVGDFNCVVDSKRDVRGPGQGGSTYHAKELVKVVRHLNLSDVWVHLYKGSFAPTRMSRYTASRIDRMYLPELLLPSVEACEVLDLPDNLVGKMDHVPLVTTVRGSPGPRFSNTSWRLDPVLLQEQESIDRTTEFLQASIERTDQITPPVWDRLKIEWKAFLQEEGKARNRRLTEKMKELLRRMQIVKGAETLTTCMSEYYATLEEKYNRVLREKTRRPTGTSGGTDDVTGADLREGSGNGGLRITETKRPDGTVTTDQREIEAIFRDFFLAQFQNNDPCESEQMTGHIRELCRNLQRLDEGETENLGSETTLEELRCAIESMTPNSAPGADGLTTGFYATFFDVLGEALQSLVNAILTKHQKPASFGVGSVVLLC